MRYLMSITAQDRSGIVAAITAGGLEVGGNIEAASQTVHQGYFAMVVLWATPEGVSRDDLLQAVQGRAGDGFHIYVTEYHPLSGGDAGRRETFIVTSLGPDRPGILNRLASYLASKQINLDDLYCCVEDGQFVVIGQASVPVDTDVFMLQADLEALGGALGVAIRMQHEDIFVATNELPLRRQWRHR